MRAAAFSLALIMFAGAAGAAEHEVPWKDIAANVEEHRVIEAMDEASFAAAEAHYPGTEKNADHYAVGVGRYLMWQIVHLFPSDRTVDAMRLASFDERCDVRTDEFGSSVRCSLSAVLEVDDAGDTHRIAFETTRPVGAWMKSSEPYQPAVAAEVRLPVDDFVSHIETELDAAGIAQ